MALYHFHRSYVSRSSGRSSVAACAYIVADKIQDARLGTSHDYSRKKDVAYTAVVAPSCTPQALLTHEALWNQAEQVEDEIAQKRFPGHLDDQEKNTRSMDRRSHVINNARVAFSDNIALPKELTLQQSISLVQDYAREHIVAHGLAASVAIHWEEGNPHFHIQTTTRTLREGQFSENKCRALNDRSFLVAQRQGLAQLTNAHLERAGLETRVDHRSYKDQGVGFAPTRHQGWQSKALEAQQRYTRIGSENQKIREENIRLLAQDPTQIIKKVANEHAVFTHEDIATELFKLVGGDSHLFEVLNETIRRIEIPGIIGKAANDNLIFSGTLTLEERLKFAQELQKSVDALTKILLHHDESLFLGSDLRDQAVYTSATYKERDTRIRKSIEALQSSSRPELPPALLDEAFAQQESQKGYGLSQDQREAALHVCKGETVSLVVGRAGTGKTTMLSPVAQAYQNAGYRVLGASALGKAVDVMEREIGIPSHTLDRYRIAWTQYETLVQKQTTSSTAARYCQSRLAKLKQYQLTDKDVLIVDEANMVGSRLWAPLLQQIEKSGAKLIVVQDPQQLKPVLDASDIGSDLIDAFGAATLQTIYRQSVDWHIQASQYLNDHDVSRGLALYHAHQKVTFAPSPESAKWHLVASYLEDRDKDPRLRQMVLAFKNADVKDLNAMIRHQMVMQNKLAQPFLLHQKEYAVGDRIVFEKNDHQHVRTCGENGKTTQQGIKNGNLGTIVRYDEAKSLLYVALDEGKRTVCFHTESYPHFCHGYAMTIHKSEGETTDKTYLLVDSGMNANLMLVGATRHRKDMEIFVNKERLPDILSIAQRLSRQDFRPTLQDFTIHAKNRDAFDRMQRLIGLCADKQDMLCRLNQAGQEKDAIWQTIQTFNAQICDVAHEVLGAWPQHQRFAAQLNMRKESFEIIAGLRERPLSDLEIQAMNKLERYNDLCMQSRTAWQHIRSGHPIATQHPHYQDYIALQQMRNQMAHDIAAFPTLYKPLMKMIPETEMGLQSASASAHPDWSSVLSHNDQFMKAQHLKFYQSRLDGAGQAQFARLEAYKSAVMDVARGVQALKEAQTPQERHTRYGALDQAIQSRDTAALHVVASPMGDHLHLAKLSIDENKLLDHAIAGERDQRSGHILPQPQEAVLSPLQAFAQDLERYDLSAQEKAGYMKIAQWSVADALETLKVVDALIKPECNHLAQISQGQLCENELNKLLKAFESNSNQMLVTKDPEKQPALQENLQEVAKQLAPYQPYLAQDMQDRVGALQENGKTEELSQNQSLNRERGCSR